MMGTSRGENSTMDGDGDALARFETTPHGVLVVAPDRTIQFADHFSHAIFGYAKGELTGRPLLDLLPTASSDLQVPDPGLPPALLQLEGQNRAGRVLVLEVAIARGGSPDGDLLVAVREVAPASLRNEHAHRRDLMDVLARFASTTCHDLKNHLMALTGYTELAMGRIEKDPERAQKMLAEVLDASDRMLAYVEQMHALGRGRPEGIVATDMRTYLEGIAPKLKATTPEGVTLDVDASHATGWTDLESKRLTEGLRVLIENAAENSPAGGVVKVRGSTLEIKDADALPDLPAGTYATLEVSDRGRGMDDEERAHLFEPFLKGGRDRGRGLGLATLYMFVRKLGGGIVVNTLPGAGTSVRIHLPLREAPISGPDALVSDETAPPSQDRSDQTVLVVDDIPIVRDIAREALEEAGYRVLSAGTGQEALEIVETRNGHRIALLLTDVLMPGMSGPELARTVCDRYPEIPVLFMSAYSREPLPTKLAGRPVPFIAKPFTPKDLAIKVGAVLKSCA